MRQYSITKTIPTQKSTCERVQKIQKELHMRKEIQTDKC